MITIDRFDCPTCIHTNSSHDSQHGCLFPYCPCRETDPRLAGLRATLAQAAEDPFLVPADDPRMQGVGLGTWMRYILGGIGSAVVIGIMLAVAIFTVMLAAAYFNTPEPTHLPAPATRPTEFPLQTARQEALHG